MLCTQCKHKKATVHYVSVVNGIKQEFNICPSCASKLGMAQFSPFSWGDMMITMPKFKAAMCQKCGTTVAELKSSGLIGCENCYGALATSIEPILRKVQKGTIHCGRLPVSFEAVRLSESSTVEVQISEKEQLKRKLENAISEQDFENAAIIRDQIKALKED